MAEDKSLDDILMSSEDLIAQEKLDSGGYGLVSLCKHRIHGLVVLKTVYTGFKNPMYNDKLLEEGKIMHMLKNDRVVKLLGLILEEGNYSLVMEYLRNGNLMTILHKVFVPMSIKARFIMEIIEGMTYLHDQNVIHKDVKPQNILADENFHIKIADLGVATFKKWSTLTKEEINRQRKYPNKSTDSTRKSNAGTLIYMAPEHLKSLNVKSTEKSDVYSFAIVIWVILMDKEPYENAHNEDHISFCVTRNDRPDMEDLPDDCPEAIELMVKCWEDNPEERPTFKECDYKFRPCYETKHKKYVERDVEEMKNKFESPHVLIERMASLQLDCNAEPASIQPRDQPQSLHSSGFMSINMLDESFFNPANEPIESEDPKSDEILVRKLEDEMNYHQKGGRMNNTINYCAPNHSYITRNKKVFNEASTVNHPSVNIGNFAGDFGNPPYLESSAISGNSKANQENYFSEKRQDIYRSLAAECNSPFKTPSPTASSNFSKTSGDAPIPKANWVRTPIMSPNNSDKFPTPESDRGDPNLPYPNHVFGGDGGYKADPVEKSTFNKGNFGFVPPSLGENAVNLSISNSNAIQIGNNNHLSLITHKPMKKPEAGSISSNLNVKDQSAFDCQTSINENHLQLLRENLAKKWKLFARYLGFREPEIDEIDHDYERDGLQEKVHQTLHKWQMREGSKNATVGKVARALYHLGENKLLHALMNTDP